MKRFLLLCVLSALPVLCRAAWAPSVSCSVSYHGAAFSSSYDSLDSLRSSVEASVSVNPLAFSFGRHRLSMPLGLSYISRSPVVDRAFASERYEILASAEYGCRILERIALALSFDARLSCYPSTSSALWRFGMTLKGSFALAKGISLSVPLSLMLGQAETALSLGLALSWGKGGWA